MATQNQPEKPHLVFEADIAPEVVTTLSEFQDRVYEDPELHAKSLEVYSTGPALVMKVLELARNHPEAVDQLRKWHELLSSSASREAIFDKKTEESLSKDQEHQRKISEARAALGEKAVEATLKVRASRFGSFALGVAKFTPKKAAAKTTRQKPAA